MIEDEERIRNMKKKTVLAVIAMIMVMSFTACGNSEEAVSSGKSAANEAISDSTQVENPFTEVDSLAEAEKMTGFSMEVPEAMSDYPDMTIRVMDSRMIEVIYENHAQETEENRDEGFRIRKEKGSDDISGDYREYASTSTEMIDGSEVTFRGEDDTVSVAVWTSDGYSYAVDAEDHPLTVQEMTEIVESVK